MDVDILKPDTGYLSVIERPSAISSSKGSTHASTTPAKTPMAPSRSGSGGSNSPVAQYTEPLSEGEEDEDEMVAAKDEDDETKRTGLNSEEVKAAIAYREQMLKERREEEEEARKREKKAGKDKDMGTAEEAIPQVEEPGINAEYSLGKPGRAKRPVYHETISHKLRTRVLAINPLAPSTTFDETLKTKLEGAREREEVFNKHGRERYPSSPSNDQVGAKEYDLANEEALLGGPSNRDVEDRILERNWRAPEGKKIAVPVRIEPKVYFAAERTFLVSIFQRFSCAGIVCSPFAESLFSNRNGSTTPSSLALLRRRFSTLSQPRTPGD